MNEMTDNDYVKNLEEQVFNLTQDCYYLMSLLNTNDEIDWRYWKEGAEIRKHLEQSKKIADQVKANKLKQEQEKELQELSESERELQEQLDEIKERRKKIMENAQSSSCHLDDNKAPNIHDTLDNTRIYSSLSDLILKNLKEFNI